MSELELNTTNRVQVNRGDYFAALGVFHYIHCLNNLRKVVHWDYYGPKVAMSGREEAYSKEHSGRYCQIMCTQSYLADNNWHRPLHRRASTGANVPPERTSQYGGVG
ncbi:hypothetical protein GGR53DRAFT_500381, partial [Hypoxylon sp. FL1150]